MFFVKKAANVIYHNQLSIILFLTIFLLFSIAVAALDCWLLQGSSCRQAIFYNSVKHNVIKNAIFSVFMSFVILYELKYGNK